MNVYRTPDERFAGLPGYDFEPHYMDQDGLRMHYVDEGAGGPVMMLHGEPTWSYLYRKMIRRVAAAGHRVLAPDLFGFGRSDKPADLQWYSAEGHARSVQGFLESLDLRDVTLVVHDWGGPIGLGVATRAEERFRALVILNTGLFSGQSRMSEGWWAFHDFVDRAKPDLPIGLLVSRTCFTEPAPEVVAAYEAPFPEPDAKWGASAFPLLVPTTNESPGAAWALETARRLRDWSKPALVCFSDSDPIFSTRTGERFVERIPGAPRPLTVINEASHFLQEDKGEEIADRVVEFLASI